MNKCILIFFVFVSCRQYNDRPDPQQTEARKAEYAAEMNRQLVKEEAEQINGFIGRHHFKMEMTGTGLRYQLYYKGKGTSKPVLHDAVSVSYKRYFLDGELNFETTKPVAFRLGEGAEIRGLEEGIMMMNEGDSARFIVPSHLAFGLTGDGNTIPPAATLYYDITLHKISK